MRNLPALLVAILAVSAPSALAAPASPSCREGFTCPVRAGRVEVTLEAFDGSGATGNEAGVLDADEIQCALDCLDGDPDPDHVLAGPRAPRTPTKVMGGTLLFDPAVTYRVQRSLRLPAATEGPLVIDGQGARLTIARASKEPISVLERRAPEGANTCDVEAMASWSMLWTIENLFIAGDGSEGDAGIVIHGSNSLTIRSCALASLGTGVDLRFALVPVVDQCVFMNNRRHDVYLGPGDAECGPSGTCFPACVKGPAVFTQAGSSTKQLTEGGCNSGTVRHCRFLMHPQQLSSIRIRNSRAPVIDGATFDGVRGRHAIHHSHYLANELTVRDMYFETNISAKDAVIRFDGGSRLLVEGLHLVGGADAVLIDAADAQGCFVTLRHVPWLPADVKFKNGANTWRNEWRFQDVSAQDLASAARWTGGPPPRALVVDGIASLSRPQEGAVHALRVPVGAPTEHGGKLENGQIWIDSKTGRLMTCCDEMGRPRAAGK